MTNKDFNKAADAGELSRLLEIFNGSELDKALERLLDIVDSDEE